MDVEIVVKVPQEYIDDAQDFGMLDPKLSPKYCETR